MKAIFNINKNNNSKDSLKSLQPELQNIELPQLFSRGHEYGVKHILIQNTESLPNFLNRNLGLQKDDAQLLVNLGSIYKNNRRLNLETAQEDLQPGDYLRVHTTPRRYSILNINWAKYILQSTNEFIIVDKPAGIPTHATVDNALENLHVALENYYAQKFYVTHRLDIPTSGLIVFAKTQEFQRRFNSLLTTSGVEKYYTATVDGRFSISNSTLIHYMEPTPRAPKRVVSQPQVGYAECRLEIVSVTHESDVSHLLIRLITGRTHQIRAQLSAIGFPIIGDKQYGSLRKLNDTSTDKEAIALRCVKLKFSNEDVDLRPDLHTEAR